MTQQPSSSPENTMLRSQSPPLPSRQLLSAIFSSLSSDSRRWSLTRTLHSDNPMDIKGELHGTATFQPLLQRGTGPDRDMVYREEGEMPNMPGMGMGMAGLRWSKRYIWRLSESGKISVWFVKVGGGGGGGSGGSKKTGNEEEEADYLFHEFDFNSHSHHTHNHPAESAGETFVTAPIPPVASIAGDTAVLAARGNHLCINDMYRTAYAFRVHSETGEVLSWSSRHMVKGPKKDQDIVNIYQRENISV